MSGSGQDALPEVQEWSDNPPGCPGVVERPSRMSGNGRETLPDFAERWDTFLDVREWSRDLLDVCETHSDVREWSGGSLGYPGVVGRLPRMFESGRDALPDVWEWSGGTFG